VTRASSFALLAAEMPKSVSPTAWEFKLRKGVKFHNGEEFNAESVKFSVERLLNPANKLRGSSSFAPIERVEVVDHLSPCGSTPRSRGRCSSTTSPSARPPCTRPRSTPARTPRRSRSPDRHRTLQVRPVDQGRGDRDGGLPRYWGGAAKIKTVVFKPIPDDAVRVAALQNGEIDVAVNIPPHMAGIIDKHPKIFLSTAPSIRTIQLMIYTHQMDAEHKPTGPYAGPTADKRVRQALAYAIDADEIIKSVMDGKAGPRGHMLPSMHFGYDA
jgi:peptide/nickel transport system substrate-binding protein